jgi:hypothetical protein
MASNDYQLEQINSRLNAMGPVQWKQAVLDVAALAPDAVAQVLGLTDIARLGTEAYKHQQTVLADYQKRYANNYADTQAAYAMIDDFNELASQDLQLAESGELAAGITALLAIIQLFPWIEERTHGVITTGMAGMWLDGVATELHQLPDNDEGHATATIITRAINNPDFTGVRKYLVDFQNKIG